MSNIINADQLDNYIGQEVGLSDWLEIDQPRIDKFADATGDHQYIHVDAERAAQTPFGATIAHGFLILSLISTLNAKSNRIKLENTAMIINYGLDKVRFINPVKVGSKIRARFELTSAEEKQPKHHLMKHKVTIEIQGEDKPALIAESLLMAILS
jgi:acyl dehydratase